MGADTIINYVEHPEWQEEVLRATGGRGVDLSRFVEATGIRPVIDKVFKFGEAVEAYRHLEAGRHFGKIVVARG